MARIDDVRELASKVMGWEVQSHFNGIRLDRPGRVSWYPKNLGGGVWDPYTDANAALEVVEGMRSKGFCMQAEHLKDGWYVRFVLVADYSWNSALKLSFCEAICTAALAAIREGQ